MRNINQGSFIADTVLIVDSSTLINGVTGLTFSNSGDVQLKKQGSSFSDISSAIVATERGNGWYDIVSSESAHTNTLGKIVLHFPANSESVVTDLVLNVVASESLADDISSIDAAVTSLSTQIGNLQNGIVQGSIEVPTATVIEDTPITVYKATYQDFIFYVGQTWSSYASWPVYFTAKEREGDSTELWSVQGSITNATSMSAVFSLHPSSDSNVTAGENYPWQIEFRTSSEAWGKVAMTGFADVTERLKN